ncbi:hypothetical protein K530_50975 [Streptomyces noursei CCRC 11814]|nr:hypothetical protein K530_50975 [Streptomyces noursei CCRC 11814]
MTAEYLGEGPMDVPLHATPVEEREDHGDVRGNPCSG